MLILFAALAVTTACPPCNIANCPQDPERDCLLGPSPDPCQCCSLGTCGLEEGQPCYNATIFKNFPDRRRLGACASNMMCIVRNDLGPSDGLETVCVCLDQRTACGSDNKTYDSTCRMYHVEENKRVSLQHWGPCQQEPEVTSGPEGDVKSTGQPIVLACEAKGFPVPAISWQFVGKDGTLIILPGDDQSVSVQIRGGPEALMVSSWVQILQGRPKDSGTYSCLATNDKGSTRAMAQIVMKSVQ